MITDKRQRYCVEEYVVEGEHSRKKRRRINQKGITFNLNAFSNERNKDKLIQSINERFSSQCDDKT